MNQRSDKNRWDFLISKIKENGYEVGVEIGVKAGRTSMEILKACKNVKMYAIDPWIEQELDQLDENGKQKPYCGDGWTQEKHNKSKEVAYARLSGFKKRAEIIEDFSVPAAEKFEDESLDFVFIDGDHSYDGCKNDIEAWGKKVRPGGLISGHDINWPGVKTAVEEAFQQYKIAVDHVWAIIK